jgi:hypothetical protein
MCSEAGFGAAAVRYASVHIGVRGSGTHGHARTAGQERDADRLAGFWPLTCRFRMPARCPCLLQRASHNSGAMFRQFLYGVYSGPAQHSVVRERAQQFTGLGISDRT